MINPRKQVIILALLLLLFISTVQAAGVLSLNADNKDPVVAPETKTIGVALSKPTGSTPKDVVVTLEIIGPARFTGGTTTERITLGEVNDDWSQPFSVELTPNQENRATITIKATASYYPVTKRFGFFGGDVRPEQKTTETTELSFTGAWTETAPIQDELNRKQQELNQCNTNLEQYKDRSQNCSMDLSGAKIEIRDLKTERWYFLGAGILATLFFIFIIRIIF